MLNLRGCLAFGLLWVAACAHAPAGEIVEPRDLDEASAAPVITQVQELGGADVVVPGVVRAGAGDQIAVVGEGLWIQGRAFGRQPTVLVAGLPAFVQARTADAGIVVRVPPGVPAGKQVLRVSTRGGASEVSLNVRRYAAAWNNHGALNWVTTPTVHAPAVVSAAKGSAPAVAKLVFSSDGRAAYAVDPSSRHLSVYDVTTQGGPLVAFTIELEGTPVVGLATAAAAPVLVVLRTNDVIVLSTTSAIRPPRSRPRTLPENIAKAVQEAASKQLPVAAAVSPDGRFLALAMPNESRVVLLTLADREHAKVVANVVVDASVRAPPVLDLGFSGLGDTLWALSGPRGISDSTGPLPTQVLAMKFRHDAGSPRLVVDKTLDLAAGAPFALGVSRSQPLPSGAAIRRPPMLAQVMVAAAGQGDAAQSQLVAVGLQGPAIGAPIQGHATDVLIEPQGQFAMAPVIDLEGAVNLLSIRVDGRAADAQTTPLWPSSQHVGACAVEVQP